jgi:hypothetical protein
MKQILLIVLAVPTLLFSQTKHTINGKIKDQETGEDLIGASVVAVELTSGAITNTYGFYSLSLPEGYYSIHFSYVGYDTQILKLHLNSNQTVNIELEPTNISLGEVVVSSIKHEQNLTSATFGSEKIQMKDIKSIPVLFGEKDILKTIQLLPGISSSSEGTSGFNVRGGSMDQNLILLDEATVYSASHLMGFFSVFNSDALKDATIYRGGIPAKYGGRASSVLNITMNNGNCRSASGSLGIGLISSKFTFETPIIRDKISVCISGRRAYADWIAKKIAPEDIVRDDFKLYFFDLNAKVNYTINNKNRIFFSSYMGKDFFVYTKDIGSSWGNKTATLRWNHFFNNKLFSNTSVIYSKYDYGFNIGRDDLYFNSGIEDISFKEDITYYLNPSNTFKFGLKLTKNTFYPGEISGDIQNNTDNYLTKKTGIESGIYFLNENKLSKKITANYGFRLSNFNTMGPVWHYTYNSLNKPIDSTYYKNNEFAQSFFSLEPRLSLNYMINTTSSVKFSYNRMAQYLNLLSNNTSGVPTDIWMPASNNLKPLYVDQVSTGFFRNFFDNSLESSLELYYKYIQNKADYEDGADILFNEHAESQILIGNGRSYGIEFYLKKKYGKFSGWISYTLSRTENKIDGINNFNWYPVKFDKTHDLSLVGSYKIHPRITVSSVWTYSTGNAVTYPSGKYEVDGNLIPYYTDRNGQRMPEYHRLDLSISIQGKKRTKIESSWDLSVYNVYNRHNAYSIKFKESETKGTTEAVKLSLFGVVPSVSYNLNF